MTKFSRFAVAGLSAVASASALAGAPVGSYYIAPELLWVNPDGDLSHAASHDGFHVALGTVLSEKWDAELGYSDTSHDTDPRGTLSFRGLDLTFNRVFNRDGRVNPFLGLGVTALTTKWQGTGFDSNNLGAKIGGGLLADLFGGQSWKVQLLGELGTRFDKVQRTDGINLDSYAGIGLRLAFGGSSAPSVAAPAPAAAPVVVAAPAPSPPAAPAVAAPPAPVPVADSDHDGVPDSTDRCPNTPAGDKVDAAGCGLTIQLQVLFDNNSATIEPQSYGELDGFVAFLKEVPSARGSLEGHTDNVGSDAYNLRLSQARADAVKAYAVGKGIDASRLEAKGYGESRPVTSNATAEGRAQNRRVLFIRLSLQQ